MNKPTCSLNECSGRTVTRGWCKKHYERWRRTGNPLGVAAISREERFWSKVDRTPTCWNWTASINRDGYGMFKRDGVDMTAHKAAWTEAYGEPPTGRQLDHRCHNRRCVNVSHMRLVTQKQNMENRRGAHSNSKSGIRGVHWSKSHNQWCATVNHNGKHVYIAYFADITEAEAAVISKRNEIFTHNDLDRPKG
jgi:hypothetical protein